MTNEVVTHTVGNVRIATAPSTRPVSTAKASISSSVMPLWHCFGSTVKRTADADQLKCVGLGVETNSDSVSPEVKGLEVGATIKTVTGGFAATVTEASGSQFAAPPE